MTAKGSFSNIDGEYIIFPDLHTWQYVRIQKGRVIDWAVERHAMTNKDYEFLIDALSQIAADPERAASAVDVETVYKVKEIVGYHPYSPAVVVDLSTINLRE